MNKNTLVTVVNNLVKLVHGDVPNNTYEDCTVPVLENTLVELTEKLTEYTEKMVRGANILAEKYDALLHEVKNLRSNDTTDENGMPTGSPLDELGPDYRKLAKTLKIMPVNELFSMLHVHWNGRRGVVQFPRSVYYHNEEHTQLCKAYLNRLHQRARDLNLFAQFDKQGFLVIVAER